MLPEVFDLGSPFVDSLHIFTKWISAYGLLRTLSYGSRRMGRDIASLHIAHHCGEIVVSLGRQRGVAGLKGRLGSRHAAIFGPSQIQNQSKILVHQAQRELRAVLTNGRSCKLSQ